MNNIDPYDPVQVAGAFGIAEALAQEIMHVNDDWNPYWTPEERYREMLAWVRAQIGPKEEAAPNKY